MRDRAGLSLQSVSELLLWTSGSAEEQGSGIHSAMSPCGLLLGLPSAGRLAMDSGSLEGDLRESREPE